MGHEIKPRTGKPVNPGILFDQCLQMYQFTSSAEVPRKFRGSIPRKKFMNEFTLLEVYQFTCGAFQFVVSPARRKIRGRSAEDSAEESVQFSGPYLPAHIDMLLTLNEGTLRDAINLSWTWIWILVNMNSWIIHESMNLGELSVFRQRGRTAEVPRKFRGRIQRKK